MLLNFREWLLLEAIAYTGSTIWATLRNKERLTKKIKAVPQLQAALWHEIYMHLQSKGWTGNPTYLVNCLRHDFTTYEDEMNIQYHSATQWCKKLQERLLLTVAAADLIAGIIDNVVPQQYRSGAHEYNKQWVQTKQQEYQAEAQKLFQNKLIPNACPSEFLMLPANFAV